MKLNTSIIEPKQLSQVLLTVNTDCRSSSGESKSKYKKNKENAGTTPVHFGDRPRPVGESQDVCEIRGKKIIGIKLHLIPKKLYDI